MNYQVAVPPIALRTGPEKMRRIGDAVLNPYSDPRFKSLEKFHKM